MHFQLQLLYLCIGVVQAKVLRLGMHTIILGMIRYKKNQE